MRLSPSNSEQMGSTARDKGRKVTVKIRDLVFGDMAKERPKCREGIVKSGLRPNPDVENWNGETALDSNGREIFLSPVFERK